MREHGLPFFLTFLSDQSGKGGRLSHGVRKRSGLGTWKVPSMRAVSPRDRADSEPGILRPEGEAPKEKREKKFITINL